MKKYITACAVPVAAACALFCSCTTDAESSLKELTHPYIARYECTMLNYGGVEMYDRFDYIRITLEDRDEMLAEYKLKGGKPHEYRCGYTYDQKTGEFYADCGAAGFMPKQPIIIENGSFTISFPVAGRQLTMRFES